MSTPISAPRSFGSQLTYPGCGTCLKAWREEGATPCQCPAAERVHLWRARLGLRDATGQVQAVCFKALESVVEVYGDVSSDAEKAPGHFSSEEIAERLASCVAAVPFTGQRGKSPELPHGSHETCEGCADMGVRDACGRQHWGLRWILIGF